MALIVFDDDTRKFIPADKAETLWEVWVGEATGSKEQQAYASKVKRIYLNQNTAPDSYLVHYGFMPQLKTPVELLNERYK